MDIIIVSNKKGRMWRATLSSRNVRSWLPLGFVAFMLLGLTFMMGYGLKAFDDRLPVDIHGIWADEIQTQRQQLAQMRDGFENNTQALARRLAELHAHVTRLDAAGARITQMANLDKGEFDFSQPPPLGGPEEPATDAMPLQVDGVFASLDAFENQLSDRERQMRVLEDLLLASRLQKQVRPSGWPIEPGWVSSGYGMRIDPFTGLRAYHAGVDFAAPVGSDVLSVASGIVTDVGERFGYGVLVEINHGNGYTTRYGHNSSAAVKVGDQVRKGQAIARIGSTGRSTGPHVHFEVMLNGKVVNPAQYIDAAR
ncbi:MAG: M23 family metallopeptidase [Pseudomonadota bacterium]